MKDILRSGVKVLVPDLDETIGLMRGRRVLGVCSQNKFGELWGVSDLNAKLILAIRATNLWRKA